MPIVVRKKTKKIAKNFFLFLTPIIFILLIFFVLNREEGGIPHSNNVDLKISLFSKNVTEEVRESRPQFAEIAFAELPPKDNKILPGQFATVFRAFKRLLKAEDSEDLRQEYGTWLWTPTLLIDDKYTETIISDLAERGVNTVYISINSYVDIFVLENDELKKTRKKKFENILENFIKKANEKGIIVDAVAGWQNWAEVGHTYKPFAVANFVKDFNAKSSYRFRGFQYDVEPYLLTEFQTEPEKPLKNFVKLVDDTKTFFAGSGISFSVVIPDFFDKKDSMTPTFSYRGRRDSVFGHLLEILEDSTDSRIIIMSYRNFADGKDSSVAVSKNEMNTAKRGVYSTKIIIAQETGEFPPPYITFHGTSKSYFTQEIGKLQGVFLSHPNYAGLAVHYANSFLELK